MIVNLTNAEVEVLTIFVFHIFIEKKLYTICPGQVPFPKELGPPIPLHILSVSLSLETNRKTKTNKQTIILKKRKNTTHINTIHKNIKLETISKQAKDQ